MFRALVAALPESIQRQVNEAYRLFTSNPYRASHHFKPIDPADPSIYTLSWHSVVEWLVARWRG
jgi:hypothetical protein